MNTRLQVGGALRAGAFYVEREADRLLPQVLAQGALCTVLAPRQIGKSSLRAHSAALLRAQGLRVATVDLSALGAADLSPETWFYGLVTELLTGLGEEDPQALWDASAGKPSTTRFLSVLEAVVVRGEGPPAVVFLDEIDAIRALPFQAEDLFAAVRAAWDRRAEDPAWARLTFCLLGVASPAELMQDPLRTPFNVGRDVRLQDFTPEEAQILRPALQGLGCPAQELLDHVLAWTSGHPYQTAQLCQALVEEGESKVDPALRVAGAVARLYHGAWPDPSLDASARALRESSSGELLTLYRRCLSPQPPAWESREPAQTALLLTGLAAVRGGALRVRNRVVASLYDAAWVETNQGRRALRQRAWAWVQRGRPDQELASGAELLALRQGAGPDLELEESEYLLRAEAYEQRVLSERRARRLRGAALVLALLAALVTLYVGVQRRELTQRAQVQALSDHARLAQVPGRQEDALVQALNAWAALQETPFAPLATQGLASTLEGVRGPLLGQGAAAAAFWWDSDALMVGRKDGRLEILDRKGRVLRSSAVKGRVMVLSRWGDAVLVGTEDGAIHRWDPASGDLRSAAAAHSPAPRLACREELDIPHATMFRRVAAAGPWALSVGGDGALRLWDQELSPRPPLALGVTDLAVSDDARSVAVVDVAGRLQVWNLEDLSLSSSRGPFLAQEPDPNECEIPEEMTHLTEALFKVVSVGEKLAVVGRRGRARVLPWQGDGEGVSLHHPGIAVVGVALSPDGSTVATTDLWGVLRVFDAHTGQLRHQHADHTQSTLDLVFSADGGLLASTGHDDSTRLWDPQSGALLWTSRGEVGTGMDLDFSPDGVELLAASEAGVRHYATGSPLVLDQWPMPGRGRPSGLSAGQEVVAVAWTDGAPSVRAPGQREEQPWPRPQRVIDNAAFDPDGRRLLWSGPEGSELVSRDQTLAGPFLGRSAYWSDPWSLDGTRLALTEGAEGFVLNDQGERICTLEVPIWPGPLISPDGAWVLAGGRDGSLRRFDARTGRSVRQHTLEHNNPTAQMSGLSWRADSGFYAVAGPGRWGVQDPGPSPEQPGQRNGFWSAWAGDTLWTARRGGGLSAWDAEGRSVHNLVGHRSTLRSAQLSPDGRLLAVSDETGEVRLWSTEGPLLWTWAAHRGIARLLDFSPDGRSLYSAGDDGLLLRLPGSPEALVQLACEWLGARAAEAAVCANAP